MHEKAVTRFRLEGDVKFRPGRDIVLDLPWVVRGPEGSDPAERPSEETDDDVAPTSISTPIR